MTITQYLSIVALLWLIIGQNTTLGRGWSKAALIISIVLGALSVITGIVSIIS